MSDFKISPEVVQQYHEVIESLGPEILKEMLQTMHNIRTFEVRAEQLYGLGRTYGTMHLSIGQEATAVGASTAMEEGDYLLNHHRGHGHCMAWGASIDRMMAEFLGKETGYCRGRGGSMHIADVENNNLGANGIVAGGIPIAVGVGLSIKMRKTSQVCLVIFGDGAANEGAFHESLNMASIWNLPVIYLCENNQYAMSMSVERAFNIERISERASSYGIPGVSVDGNDTLAVYLAVREAGERARRGEGPTLVESITYRYKGHSRSDRQAYRTRDEVKEWQDARDPIKRFESLLRAAGIISEVEAGEIGEQAVKAVENAVAFSDNSPDPDVSTLLEGVYG